MGEGGVIGDAVGGAIDSTGNQRSQVAHQTALTLDNISGTPGQGFTLSLDQAHSALKDVNGFLAQLDQMKASARDLQRLKPPAQDVASVDYNGKLTEGGPTWASPLVAGAAFDAAVTQIDDEIRYLETLREKLYKALGITSEADADNKKAIGQAGANQNESLGGIAG
jgi:hypothetical protein